MITDKAKHKARILAFWEKHGLEAVLDAFPQKRSTLFLWKKELRQEHPNLGKDKIKPLKRAKKLRKPKSFKAEYPGHLCALDIIEEFVCGLRRYVITLTDNGSEFAKHFAQELKRLCIIHYHIYPRRPQDLIKD